MPLFTTRLIMLLVTTYMYYVFYAIITIRTNILTYGAGKSHYS